MFSRVRYCEVVLYGILLCSESRLKCVCRVSMTNEGTLTNEQTVGSNNENNVYISVRSDVAVVIPEAPDVVFVGRAPGTLLNDNGTDVAVAVRNLGERFELRIVWPDGGAVWVLCFILVLLCFCSETQGFVCGLRYVFELPRSILRDQFVLLIGGLL